MFALKTVPILLGAIWCLSGNGLRAQTIERSIRNLDGVQPLVRPVQIALSPSGASLAVCDQQGDRIYVIDTDGNPLWTIGSGSVVKRPTTICFESDNALLYCVDKVMTVFRAGKENPDIPDTVADLSSSLPDGTRIDRLISLGKKGYLILDRKQGAVYRLKSDWTLDKKLISQGSSKGRLWSPTDIAVDLSGNTVVSDEKRCPVQAFTSSGQPLWCGSWNLNEPQRSWDASTIGLSTSDAIWAADISNLAWRVFDRAGIQIAQYPFETPLYRPNSIVITNDKNMFVADDNGMIIIISLP